MRRAPLALAALAAAALTLLACDDEPPPPAATNEPRVLVEEKPPAPAPVPANPEHRKFDQDGELLASVNDLFGFRLPVGVERVSQDRGEAVLRVVTPMAALVRFYTTRGYQVLEGRRGYTVRHAQATLEGRPNRDTLAEAVLYLRDGAGRYKELRFYAPTEPAPAAEAAAAPDPFAEPPPADAPRRVKERYERIRKWKEAHPGQPLPH